MHKKNSVNQNKSQTNEHDANIVLYKRKWGLLTVVLINMAKYGFPSLAGAKIALEVISVFI